MTTATTIRPRAVGRIADAEAPPARLPGSQLGTMGTNAPTALRIPGVRSQGMASSRGGNGQDWGVKIWRTRRIIPTARSIVLDRASPPAGRPPCPRVEHESLLRPIGDHSQ